VFVPCKPFHPCLKIIGIIVLTNVTYKCCPIICRPLVSPTNFRVISKGLPWTNTLAYSSTVLAQRKRL
jgi:hypothetical protein